MVGSSEQDSPARRGLMLVLSSPSGAGKSTLTRRLREDDPNLHLSISWTTRPRRRSEVEGRDYVFVAPEAFADEERAGGFLESAEVHGNRYGTPRAPVEAALGEGRDVIFDIDWQGTQQIAAKMRNDLVTIFILPPSMAELRARLQRRAEDDQATIERRLAKARDEIGHWGEYDYIIVNDDVSRALDQIKAILAAERLKRMPDRPPDPTELQQVLVAGGLTRANRAEMAAMVADLLAV